MRARLPHVVIWLLVVVGILVVIFAPAASAAQVQTGERASASRYHFEWSDGTVMLASVNVETWYEDGVFEAQLVIEPTSEEVATLTKVNDNGTFEYGSHLDISFVIDGLDVDSDAKLEGNPSGHTRFIGEEPRLDVSGAEPVVTYNGFNLARWVQGGTVRQVIIPISLEGDLEEGYFIPMVSVEARSSTFWPDDDDCELADGLESNRDQELCVSYGPSAQLTDDFGNTWF